MQQQNLQRDSPTQAIVSDIRFLNIKEVQQLIGKSRASIYRYLQHDPSFPKPRKLSVHSISWVSTEVYAWIESRPCAEYSK